MTGYLGKFMAASHNAYSAFRETMLHADLASRRPGSLSGSDSWSSPEARSLRYDLNWAMYQSNAYRDVVHTWTTLFKVKLGTSKHIRHVYNPAGQLGDFYAGHLWGGTLDPDAGDGETKPCALPVLTENEALRPAIAKLRVDSRWQINKDVVTLWGPVMGDAAIKVVDDPKKGMVRKELVHPAHIAWVDFDENHNVKGYEIRKWVDDPRKPRPDANGRREAVLYTERCTRDGELVVYQTFLGDKPHAWNGQAEEWNEKYGFVPLVVISHRSIGLDWGANCFHGGLPQIVEADDQASCLGDANRKALNGPWFLPGVKGPRELSVGGPDRPARSPEEREGHPEAQRGEQSFLYGPADATAISLTNPIDVKGQTEHIRDLLTGLEKRYPELLANAGLSGTVTAEAIRNARQIASTRIQSCRPGYDDAEVRTNQMAIAIGGFRNYEGYSGFNLESYGDGLLNHQIAERPVFEVDPLDDLAEESAFLANCDTAVRAGIPLRLYLARNGWSEDDLSGFDAAKAETPTLDAPTVRVSPGNSNSRADAEDPPPAGNDGQGGSP